MSLWAAPIVVSGQHSFDAPAFRKVCGILDVNNLNLVNDRVGPNVDHDIVRLDVLKWRFSDMTNASWA